METRGRKRLMEIYNIDDDNINDSITDHTEKRTIE